ncbi:unnamed protein product [Clavelina lepadiformis]|uniref:Fibronectin type-III domain-containing protein n=1 Tax=Clavelina lepadiformis TaxID=159417 RepID=A0ABP0FXZ8_CLALP
MFADLRFIVALLATNLFSSAAGFAGIVLTTTALPSPSEFKASSPTVNTINLSWNPPKGNFTGYYFYYTYGSNSMPEKPSMTFYDPSASSFLMTGLKENCEYIFQISAFAGFPPKSVASERSNFAFETTAPGRSYPLNIIQATSTSISLEWQPVDGSVLSVTYNLSWTSASTQRSGSKSGITTTSTTAYGLTPGTEYSFTIAAANAVGSGMFSEQTKSITFPRPPFNLTVTSTTENAVTLSWLLPESNYTGYNVYSTLRGHPMPLTARFKSTNTSAKIIQVTGLKPNSDYIFQISSFAGLQPSFTAESERSNFAQATTVPEKLSPPRVINTTKTSAFLEWIEADGEVVAVTYSLSWTSNNISNSSTRITSLLYNVEHLTAGTEYKFTVRAENSAGLGEISETTMAVTVPDIPCNFTTHTTTETSVKLSWSLPDGPASGYNIYYALSNQSLPTNKLIRINKESAVSFLLTGLASNSKYLFQLTSFREVDSVFVESERSGFLSAITIPSTLKEPTITTLTTTSISLKWKKAEGTAIIVTYELAWNSSTEEGADRKSDITSTSSNVTNLTPGTRYSFTVKTKNRAGVGSPSSSTVSYTYPAQPSKPLLSRALHGKITTLLVNWTKPEGNVERYRVKVYLGHIVAFDGETNDVFIVATGLEPGAAYVATVAAISGDVQGLEPDKSSANRTSPPTPTNVVLKLPLTGDGTTHLNVTWKMPNIPFLVKSYNVTLTSSQGFQVTKKYFASSKSPTTCLVGNLKPGEVYEATIQALTPSSKALVASSDPSLPSNSQSTGYTSSRLHYSWQPRVVNKLKTSKDFTNSENTSWELLQDFEFK